MGSNGSLAIVSVWQPQHIVAIQAII